MCGRYTIRAERRTIGEAFALAEPLELPPRYNVAPTQFVPVVRLDQESHALAMTLVQWGLVPSWAKEPKIGNSLINARCETVAEKPAFRSAFKARRCLVVADGFYEWKKENGKTPYYFQLKDEGPFAFAGLWERWEKGEEPLESCTLITTEANGVVGPVHARMPVILRPEAYRQWLDPDEQRTAALLSLLSPRQRGMIRSAVRPSGHASRYRFR